MDSMFELCKNVANYGADFELKRSGEDITLIVEFSEHCLIDCYSVVFENFEEDDWFEFQVVYSNREDGADYHLFSGIIQADKVIGLIRVIEDYSELCKDRKPNLQNCVGMENPIYREGI